MIKLELWDTQCVALKLYVKGEDQVDKSQLYW